jgi:hypothetical protein
VHRGLRSRTGEASKVRRETVDNASKGQVRQPETAFIAKISLCAEDEIANNAEINKMIKNAF